MLTGRCRVCRLSVWDLGGHPGLPQDAEVIGLINNFERLTFSLVIKSKEFSFVREGASIPIHEITVKDKKGYDRHVADKI